MKNTHIETLKQYCFKKLRLSDRDIVFLRLSVGKNASPSELFSYYETVVFDDLQGQHACALASLSQRLDYQGVPDDLVPRVKGVIRYYSARNAMQMKELLCLLKKLNKTNADVMILYGAAMKAYYMPYTVRYMGDISFRIKIDGLQNAISALEDTGKYTIKTSEHQLTIIKNQQKPEILFTCLNCYDSEMNHDEDVFWEDALETSFQGERIFIPSRETQLILILSNVFQAAFIGRNSCCGRIQWVQDSAFLLGKDGFSWKRLRDFCSQLDLSTEILIMLKILNDLFPTLIPEEAFSYLSLSIKEKKQIRLLLRFIKVKEELSLYVQANTGKKKSLRYCLYLSKLYWYKNRCFGKRSGFAADVISFPSFLKSSFRIETWQNFIRILLTKLRESI